MPDSNRRLVCWRARRSTDGVFVYGQLLQFENSGQIFESFGTSYNVDVTTKGESIGIKDKLGKDVYEGDLVIAEGEGCNKKEIYIVVHRGVGFTGKHYQLDHYIDLTTHTLEVAGQYFSSQLEKDVEDIKNKISLLGEGG